MRSKSNNKINAELLHFFNKECLFELAKRLEEGKYAKTLDFLENWDLLRALVTNKPELTFDYMHLLDK